ncbi:unnamed protein product, partial [Ectocarpus fasciculatus]
MHVWEYRNRRHRGLTRKPPRPQAYASAFLSRESQQHEAELQDEEFRRQELENTEVEIKQEEIRQLLMEYMDDPGGKKELDEVVENLRHWKDNCSALGFDSDGEELSLTSPRSSATTDGIDGAAEATMEERAERSQERAERSRRKNAREVFDMFDADGSRTISTSEMKALLQEMCIPMKKPQLKELMKEIDTDGSGEIDFDEFYQWYKANASAARNADKTQTVGLFATKLVKGLTGFTFRMEALRIIIAHAQAQVEKRERERFRLARPPRFVCETCGESFVSAKEQHRHTARREVHHEAWEAAKREATRRFHPVTVILDHMAAPPVEGAPSNEPHRSPDGPTARKKRLRRLVFSDNFYILYGGVGWGGMGSGDVERVEEERWINKPHPRLADPDDRRGAQLRQGQSVEGINPSDLRAKVPLEVTGGGFAPDWGGVRRRRGVKKVAGRGSSGLQHILLRLIQEKARASNVFTADDALARAKVTFRWEGWSSQQVTLHAEFNCFKEEGMGEDQTKGRIGHEACHQLSPGTYKYYFMVDGCRRVDESLPVVGGGNGNGKPSGKARKGGDGGKDNEGEQLFNVVTVTNQHLGEEGEHALVSLQQRRRWQSQQEERLLAFPTTSGPDFVSGGTSHHGGESHEGDAEKSVPSRQPAGTEATKLSLTTAPPMTELKIDSADEVDQQAPLKRINLSRQQICDDGAVSLALALRQNVRQELDLSFNRISGAGIAALAASLGDPRCRLSWLSLSQNGIGRRGGEHLGKMLAGGGEGGGGAQWGQVPCLRELVLADNMLGDDGAEDLAEGLKGHPCLQTLILDGNDIGHDGTQGLCEALLQNHSMKKLSLRRNCLLADSAESLAQMLLRNGAIETLDLAYNPIGPEGLRRLSGFLWKNTSLETLGLRGCEVEPTGVKSGIYTLAQALCTNRALTSLDLAANELDEYAGQELAHSLVKNKTLTDIDLTGNNVPDEWLRENHKAGDKRGEVYDILPSLAESLRLNRARRADLITIIGRKASPRTIHLERTRAKEARASERRQRLEKRRRRREAVERRSASRRRRHRQQHHHHQEDRNVLEKAAEEEEVGGVSGGTKKEAGGVHEETAGGSGGWREKASSGLSGLTSGGENRREKESEVREAPPISKSTGEGVPPAAVEGDSAENAMKTKPSEPTPVRGKRRRRDLGTGALAGQPIAVASPGVSSPASGGDVTGVGSSPPRRLRRQRERPARPTSPSPLSSRGRGTGERREHGGKSGGAVGEGKGSGRKAGAKSTTAATALNTAAATVGDAAEEEAVERATGNDGVRRVPGVWTRRGVWAPANKLAEDRVRVEERRVGDRQRQLREDEAVQDAGAAKRDELLEYLRTPDGEALVARVATVLVHAQREEDRATERERKEELQALTLQRKRTALMTKRRRNDGAGGLLASTATKTLPLWLTGSWAGNAKSLRYSRDSTAGPAGKTTATEATAGNAMPTLTAAATGPKATGPAKKAGWGETAASEGEGEESLATTLGGFASLVSTSSSLPSFAAASQMEEEDEEEIKRSLREMQDGKKAWDAKHRPPFLKAFGRFDPEGLGEMLASDIGDLMAQLRLPEAVRPEEVKKVTAQLTKIADEERKVVQAARERAIRRSGLDQGTSVPRPFTMGSGEKTVCMTHVWRWHRREHLQWRPSFTAPSRKELRQLNNRQRKRERSGEVRIFTRRV